MSLTPAWPSTAHTFRKRSGQQGLPRGGVGRTKGLIWVPCRTIPSWKVGGRQRLGNRIEPTTFAVSAVAGYWYYNHWDLKTSCFLYPWPPWCFLLPTNLHLLRLQPSANSHSTEPRGWGGNQRRGCGLLLGHGARSQLLCSVDFIWSLWAEVLAMKVYRWRLGQLHSSNTF